MQETALPAWLTKSYLEPKLRSFYKDDKLQILKLCSNAATAKGENYVGVMTRVHVEYTDGNGDLQKKTYVLKEACPTDAPQAKLFAEYNVYTREMDMYEFVLPRMAELLKEVGVTGKLHAEAVCVDRELCIILLEDLSPLKYTNTDRIKQMDLEHTKITLEMLAKFHAAATVLKQRYPEVLERNFSTGFFSRGVTGYKKLFSILYKGLLRYVKSQPKLNSRYYDKMEQLLDNLMEYAARSYDVDENDFQTLAHGDCWTTNVMFKYDDKGKPSTCLPIDFQFTTWTSPLVDLHYFFSTSLQEDVLSRQAELIQHHYYALKENLQRLNYKGVLPSLHEYHLQFDRRRFMAVLISTVFQPLMIYQGKEEPDFMCLYDETPKAIRFQDSMYESERVQDMVAKLLSIYDAKGLLDQQ